ncbi:unnamed protein product [Dimorphilus gyrociliatus]|uniref:protein xylosyltransferase n=1 Tax=Dimorphilus gyrociliatus TaxID=2664684 RepID=A0A7I8VS24_9ANNE|nr:unnamed protein product [Dimorphilus gyrociliatus]
MNSMTRLCFKYRFIFFAALIILSLQILLAYNFNIFVKRQTDQIKRPDQPLFLNNQIISSQKEESITCPETTTNRDAVSALSRIKSAECKKTVTSAICLLAKGELFPASVQQSCPMRLSNVTGRFVGCFKDERSDRELSFMKKLTIKNSVSQCVQLCFKYGFIYAGVEFGIECWCGHKIANGRKIEDKICQEMPCPGNSLQQCGGYLALAIHETGIGQPRFEKKTVLVREKQSNKSRIVFLLTLNGRAVRQVKRLLGSIYRPHHYYYIHIDERQNYLRTQLQQATKHLKNIKYAQWSMSTIWGGASLLTMHLKCMKDLFSFKTWTWDYILNLSESDFTIKSIELLENYLAVYSNSNFLRAHGKDTPKFVKKQGLEKLFVECDRHMWRVGERKIPQGIRIDGGSDWFCLSRKFVHYMVQNPDDMFISLRKYWEYSLLPSESFFHTILSNSAFCTTLVNNNLHVTNWKRSRGCRCQYKHLVDWCGCSPNIFTEMDRISPLRQHPIFFARKFDSTINQKTIAHSEELSGVKWTSQHSSFDYFWVNDYSSFEGRNEIKEIFYTNLAKLHSRSNDINLLNATLLFYEDNFEAVLIEYAKKDVVFEAKFKRKWIWSQDGGKVGGDRLVRITIGSDWDPKEEILRNWAGIVGQTTKIAIIHSWREGDTPVSATVVLVQPNGVVAAFKTETIDIKSHNLVFQPDLNLPLKPGKWSFLIFANEKKVARVSFVVLPMGLNPEFNEISKVEEFITNNLPEASPATESLNALSLVKSEWGFQGFCVVSGDNNNLCRNQIWSSHYPDPKSSTELIGGGLLREFSTE